MAKQKKVHLGKQKRVVTGGRVDSAVIRALYDRAKPSKKTINKRRGSGNRARKKSK